MAAGDDRERVLAQVREEYARRTARFDQFDQQRRQSDLRIWQRTMLDYERLLRRHGLWPLAGRSFLDVGCGRHELLVRCREQWGQAGAALCGVDLMADRIEWGRERFPYLQLECASADQLPWPDGTFDIVHQSMLLTSILDHDLRLRIAAEMARVTRPGGYLLWYDFVWNPINRQARGIGLAELGRLFPGWKMVDHRRITVAPPLARLLSRLWDPLVDLVEWLRVANLWELVLLEKP